MKIVEVKSKDDCQKWHRVSLSIHQTNPNWICPLTQDIERVFDSTKNEAFKNGIAIRWVLLDDQQQAIGRIAAFINYKRAAQFEEHTGDMGFFECINNKDAAFLLFDTAKEWLIAHGASAMNGPVNFGENNSWWGAVIEGFQEPLFRMNFSAPYYKDLLEAYGFQIYYKQLFYTFDLKKGLPERYINFAKRIKQNTAYQTRHIYIRDWKKFAHDFHHIYNTAWTSHENFKPMTEERAFALFREFRPILDTDLVWFAYHHDEPIAFFIMMPEINQLFKQMNNKGKFGIWQKLHFKWLQSLGATRKIFAFGFGVVPAFQKKGMEAFLLYQIEAHLKLKNKYDTIEIGWIGDFNPKMNNMLQALGCQQVQTAATFRLLFDKHKIFKRREIIL